MSVKAEITYKTRVQDVENGIGVWINRAMLKSLAILELNIKINTPVLHGHLRRSITSRAVDRFNGEVFTAATDGGTEIDYAKYVEYGTHKQAPAAMFRKGVAQSEQRIIQTFVEEAKSAA